MMSQLDNHGLALELSNLAARYSHYLIERLKLLCLSLKENKRMNQTTTKTFMNISISLSMASKLLPIIEIMQEKMIKEKDPVTNLVLNREKAVNTDSLDMRNLFGYLSINDWANGISMGNIMQISPLSLKDLSLIHNPDSILSRESILECFSYLVCAYFCNATEARMIHLEKNQKEEAILNQYEYVQLDKESEFWHSKSLQIAVLFLPTNCPLLKHINQSYQTNYSPLCQPILEDSSQAPDKIEIINPLKGAKSALVKPMIRALSKVNITLYPLDESDLETVENIGRHKDSRCKSRVQEKNLSIIEKAGIKTNFSSYAKKKDILLSLSNKKSRIQRSAVSKNIINKSVGGSTRNDFPFSSMINARKMSKSDKKNKRNLSGDSNYLRNILRFDKQLTNLNSNSISPKVGGTKYKFIPGKDRLTRFKVKDANINSLKTKESPYRKKIAIINFKGENKKNIFNFNL